jgi:hypothetical protein
MKKKKIILTSLFALMLTAVIGGISTKTGITKKELETHVRFLAHDERGGRFPGTPGYTAAAEYVREKLQESGLEEVCKDDKERTSFFQNVPMKHFLYGKGNSIKVKSPTGEKVFSNFNDFFIESPGNIETREITGTPVFIGCGIHEPGVWDDFAGLDIKGKPVFLMQFFPPKKDGEHVLPRDLILKYAYGFPSIHKYPGILERGASCIIHIPRQKHVEKWEHYQFLSHLFSIRPVPPYGAKWQFAPPVPELVASSAMIDYFFGDQSFDPIGRDRPYKTIEFDRFEMTISLDVTEKRISSPNVVGVVRGTDPELKNTYIVVGAHLDHLGTFQGKVFNGANDDASGCAALLEMAQELAKNPPKRSVIFTFFTGEETGLNGSRYFVENSPVPLEQIKVFINLDEVGGKKGDDRQMAINAGFLPRTGTHLETALQAAGKSLTAAVLKIEKKEPKPYLIYWVDDYSFSEKGIPVIPIGTTPGTGNDWHTPGDDVEKINFEHLYEVSRFTYALILELANN